MRAPGPGAKVYAPSRQVTAPVFCANMRQDHPLQPEPVMPDLFDGIAQWLLDQALQGAKLADTLTELGTRLIDGGVPVTRINIGRAMLHPVIGLINLKWGAESSVIDTFIVPRSAVNLETVRNQPFGDMSRGLETRIFADLTDPAVGCAAWIEAMTRELKQPLLASQAFTDRVPSGARPLGRYALRGLDQVVDLSTYDPLDA